MIPNVNIEWATIYPEITVCITAAIVLLVDLFLPKRNKWLLGAISFVGMLITLYWFVFHNFWYESTSFFGLVVCDPASSYFKIIFCLGTILTIFLSITYQKREFPEIGEFYTLILLSTFGMMVMASSADLITIFLGLEMMSIPLYVLAGIYRNRYRSCEAGLKYFLLGAFASGFLLYGIAFVYGAFGTTNLNNISVMVAAGEQYSVFYVGVGMILVLVGLAFKAGAVPFHMWIPDVYEGAPAPVTAFMSAGPKAAAIIAILRIFVISNPAIDLTYVFWILAAVTMTWGNIFALTQKNVKRMLAYSSISHVGYVLIAVAVGGQEGFSSATFYLLAYTLMNIGAFAIIILFAEREEFYENISDYAGFGQQFPFAAIAMTIFLASLGGIPGTIGFIGKFMIFKAAINNGFIWLAVIGALNSVVSIYYYLRIVMTMYMKTQKPRITDVAISPSLMVAIVISLIGVVWIGIMPEKWLAIAVTAAQHVIP
ncbi:MAG: NADH-quinone oxidoreductase subunit N [candidate division Zixibacteria bacterium]|nr:NADH-quinone oxidoreductase subunit N [candidate division Zixibacteria bacterium]